jgi:GNAT superfamily N-acetyltransferase
VKTGAVVSRVTLGTSKAHAEASLMRLPEYGADAVLLTDVYTPPSLREQGLARLCIETLLQRALSAKWAVFTYAQPHGVQISAEELEAFYERVGFRKYVRREDIGPTGWLLHARTVRKFS